MVGGNTMCGPFKAVKVTEHVHWVGAIDWALRDFHGYATGRGTTYNAYLVMAEKVALIDTVKAPFKEEMLSRIAAVVDPQDISIIVSNHSEMDHTGCLPEVIALVKPEQVFASVKGAEAISAHFHPAPEVVAVKDGDTASLGNMELSFIETRMLHWPDSMFTYLAEDELLFSQDAFGMHLATSERFADEVERAVILEEAAKYYANILLPYSLLVKNLLSRLGKLGLSIRTVAPDHGPIYRREEDIDWILKLYADWAAQQPTKKAVVVYDTMWGSTALMARAIADGIAAAGASAKVMPLRACHRSDVITELLDAGALVVGTPTINNQMFPTLADALMYLKGLKPRNLVGAAFGSYGWSGEAVAQVEEILTAMKVELVAEALKVKYVPDDDDLAKCRALGGLIAAKLKEVCGNG